ncbi:STAS domain-containing protein [Candidatus Sumerlaeota bacterium]|nr:STAS domain-containing protein [Candidatus Sumerlaeota bacterium]
MDLEITDHSDVIEIKLDGHFKDASIWGKHSDEISAVLKDRSRPVIAINLRAVQSLSSTALGSLVVFQKSIQAIKGEVILSGMTPWLMKTMRIVQFQKIFRMFKTLDEWRRVRDLEGKAEEQKPEGEKSEAEVEAT